MFELSDCSLAQKPMLIFRTRTAAYHCGGPYTLEMLNLPTSSLVLLPTSTFRTRTIANHWVSLTLKVTKKQLVDCLQLVVVSKPSRDQYKALAHSDFSKQQACCLTKERQLILLSNTSLIGFGLRLEKIILKDVFNEGKAPNGNSN